MASIEELKKRLDEAGGLRDPLQRHALVLEVLIEGLPGYRIRQIPERSVVAFFAVGRCTRESIGTVPCVPVEDDVLTGLGFTKAGRHWVREDTGTIVGPPSATRRGMRECVTDDPERERLFVELDKARWKRYLESGKIEELGPRQYRYRIDGPTDN